MKIYFATCEERPDLTDDDRILATSFASKGVEVINLIWSQPGEGLPQNSTVLIRSVWDYHKKYYGFLDWLRALANSGVRFINPIETLVWNSNKKYLVELNDKGLSCVPTLVFSSEEGVTEIRRQVKEAGYVNIVAKPSISATSYLTRRFTGSDDLEFEEAVREIGRHSQIVIQPFLDGVEQVGEVSLLFFKSLRSKTPLFSHSVIKKPKAGDFRVQIDFGGTSDAFECDSSLVEFAANALTKLEREWCYARVDILGWDRSPMISEIEMIEPDLFFRFDENSARLLASSVIDCL